LFKQNLSFDTLCKNADLTATQAAVRLNLNDQDLQLLLEGRPVPISIQNALRVEALFPEATLPPQNLPYREVGNLSCVSLFSGAGGLDIGLEQAGFTTLFANEIEKYACETLRQNKALNGVPISHFGNWFEETVATQRCYGKARSADMKLLSDRLKEAVKLNFRHLANATISENDIRDISADEILRVTRTSKGEIDLMAGGPPCQPFSRAGKREMVECEKGQLFMEFVRLVDGVRPRWFLFENVKGLILHNAEIALRKCANCGNEEALEFQLREQLRGEDAINRECCKCFITGEHKIGWHNQRGGSLDIIRAEFERLGYRCHDKVLNAADFGAPQSRERIFIVGSRDHEPFQWPIATHCDPKLLNSVVSDLFERSERRLPWTTAKQALFQEGHWRYGDLDDRHAVLWVKNVVRPHDEPVTWSLDRIAPTVGAHQSAKLAIAPYGVPVEQLFRQQWHVLGRRQGDTKPVFVEHEYLTDAELLGLQTFPASWYLHGTRMERAFQIGNAVPPILAKAVGEAIMKACGSVAVENGEKIGHSSSI
jgi:DNA (cytosine-5)-methyltransferase 1